MGIKRKRDPLARLPLKEVELLILLCLNTRPQHGYALLTAVAEASDQLVTPGPASLYRVLGELRDEGLVDEVAGDDPSDDARRRYYAVTEFGEAVLRAELGRLSNLLRRARSFGVRYGTGG